MDSQKFNAQKELQSSGVFPTVGSFFGAPFPVISKLNTPVTPKENCKLFFDRKKSYWIPDAGADFNDIYTEIVPDNVACGYAGGIDSFGVKWNPMPEDSQLPAFVETGNPKLKNIKDWRSLEFPHVDSWNWEESAKQYHEGLDPDRFTRASIMTGLFERLIALMDFGPAALALLEDPDEVIAFLEKVTAYDISLIEHYHKYFHVDAIMLLDDWGHQRGQMFSEGTFREIFLPCLKKIVARTHELGMYYIQHSDGRGEAFVPGMIEAGVDAWQLDFQAMKDIFPDVVEKYKDRILFEAYWSLPFDMTDEDAKKEVYHVMTTYCRSGAVIFTFFDSAGERQVDLRAYSYEIARKLATGEI